MLSCGLVAFIHFPPLFCLGSYSNVMNTCGYLHFIDEESEIESNEETCQIPLIIMCICLSSLLKLLTSFAEFISNSHGKQQLIQVQRHESYMKLKNYFEKRNKIQA